MNLHNIYRTHVSEYVPCKLLKQIIFGKVSQKNNYPSYWAKEEPGRSILDSSIRSLRSTQMCLKGDRAKNHSFPYTVNYFHCSKFKTVKRCSIFSFSLLEKAYFTLVLIRVGSHCYLPHPVK